MPRDGEDVGRLLHAKAAEESQLHDLAAAWIDCGEALERLVEGDQISFQ
jgi:hypothetical protein